MPGRGGGGRSSGTPGRGGRGGGGDDDNPGLGPAVESEVEVDARPVRTYFQVLTGECLLRGEFSCPLLWSVVRDASPCFPRVAS